MPNDYFGRFATPNYLKSISMGDAPDLDEVLARADAPPDLVFAPRLEGKWEGALASLGISPMTLSSQAGRA